MIEKDAAALIALLEQNGWEQTFGEETVPTVAYAWRDLESLVSGLAPTA